MAGGIQDGKQLAGWKEISAYLRTSVRTAQTLEKQQGLPVHRGVGTKAPVFALPAELDAWRKSARSSPNPPVLPSESSVRRRWLRYALESAALLAAGTIGYAIPKMRSGYRTPTGFRVDGSTLSVRGEDEKAIWRHTFPRELQSSVYAPDFKAYGRDLCLFTDVDHDGRPETLFLQVPKALNADRALACFDADGRMLWDFIPSRTVVDNLGRSFAPPFWINNFQVFRSKTVGPPINGMSADL